MHCLHACWLLVAGAELGLLPYQNILDLTSDKAQKAVIEHELLCTSNTNSSSAHYSMCIACFTCSTGH